MVGLSVSPQEISAGTPADLTIELSNTGSTPVFHVDVRFRFPSGLSHLRGEKTLSAARIGAGQTQSASMTLRARRTATYEIGLRHASYQDSHGRTYPIEESALSISAVSVPEPARPLGDPSLHEGGTLAPAKQFAVFLSYTQKGSGGITGRLYDRLRYAYGDARVFYDMNKHANPPGGSFSKAIKKGILESQVVLLLIDELWKEKVTQTVSSEDETWVRLEAEYAWHSTCTCIPVLINGTSMPTRSELPKNLKPLADINAHYLRSGRDFDRDVEDIIDAVNAAD